MERLLQMLCNEELAKAMADGYKWMLELWQCQPIAADEAVQAWHREIIAKRAKIRAELSELSGVEWEYLCVNCGAPYATESDKREPPKICRKCGENPYPGRKLGRSSMVFKAPSRCLVVTKTGTARPIRMFPNRS
jgi:hypothetical protein